MEASKFPDIFWAKRFFCVECWKVEFFVLTSSRFSSWSFSSTRYWSPSSWSSPGLPDHRQGLEILDKGLISFFLIITRASWSSPGFRKLSARSWSSSLSSRFSSWSSPSRKNGAICGKGAAGGVVAVGEVVAEDRGAMKGEVTMDKVVSVVDEVVVRECTSVVTARTTGPSWGPCTGIDTGSWSAEAGRSSCWSSMLIIITILKFDCRVTCRWLQRFVGFNIHVEGPLNN